MCKGECIMSKVTDIFGSDTKTFSEYLEKRFKTEQLVADIITRECVNKGYKEAEIADLEDVVPASKFMLERGFGPYAVSGYVSFVLETSGKGPKYHMFFVDTNEIDISDHYGQMDMNMLPHQKMNDFSEIFLSDAWEPERFKDMKFTFGFCDELLFRAVADMVIKAKVNNDMSLMLLDTDKEKIVKEVVIPRK